MTPPEYPALLDWKWQFFMNNLEITSKSLLMASITPPSPRAEITKNWSDLNGFSVVIVDMHNLCNYISK